MMERSIIVPSALSSSVSLLSVFGARKFRSRTIPKGRQPTFVRTKEDCFLTSFSYPFRGRNIRFIYYRPEHTGAHLPVASRRHHHPPPNTRRLHSTSCLQQFPLILSQSPAISYHLHGKVFFS